MTWETVTIGQIASRVTKGTTPTTYGMPFVESGVNFVKAQALNGDTSLDHSGFNFINDETHLKLFRSILQENDVLVTIAGANVGRCGIVCKRDLPANTNQAVGIIRVSFKRAHPRFVYYYFKMPATRKLCLSIGGQSAQPNVNLTILKSFKIRLPERSAQDRIVEILSVYDHLIENNRRRIALLERAAREIYREWFVRLRFPGHEHTKIVDGVPEGWEKKPLGDVLAGLESGGRPRGGAKKEGIPSIGAENVTGIGQYDYSREKYVPEEYFNAMRKGIVRNRDVVVYKDGANIGRSSCFGDGFPHEHCAVNEHVFILRGLPDVGQNFLYFWVAQEETRQRIANLNANTAQPGVSQKKLKTLSFLQPRRPVASLFNNKVESVVRQIFLLARQTQRLNQARNLFLPRLMDGRIQV